MCAICSECSGCRRFTRYRMTGLQYWQRRMKENSCARLTRALRVLAAIDGLVNCMLDDAAKSGPAAGKSLMHRFFHAFAK